MGPATDIPASNGSAAEEFSVSRGEHGAAPGARRERVHHVEEQYRRYHNPTLVRLIKFAGYGAVEGRGEGVWVYDEDGHRWLDFAGGYGVFALGHCPPRVVAAAQAQIGRLPLSSKALFNAALADLCQRLAELTPGDLQFSFIVNSGTEAVEGALKLARLATGRHTLVSTVNAYHGKTFGALSVSGRELFRTPFEPLLPDVVRIPYGDFDALETITEATAAFIVEPIQGEGGIVVPPPGWLKAARQRCTETGAMLVMDEVQTGLGRTGQWFAMQHEGIDPDILCLGKALGGGVMPIGAFVGTPTVWKAFHQNPLIHTTTFGGNPLACVTALETLQVMADEDLPARSRRLGDRLIGGLRKLQEKHPQVVAEVRGRGLMVGVELTQERYGGAVIMEMAKQRVIAVYTLNQPRVLRFEPPLIVEENHVDQALEAFDRSLAKAYKLLGGKA
ncbi:MAG TPA: aspartate aminotransferase family protein [Candidatus Xenobia bacterium]|jgi:putrescine aminotransferase